MNTYRKWGYVQMCFLSFVAIATIVAADTVPEQQAEADSEHIDAKELSQQDHQREVAERITTMTQASQSLNATQSYAIKIIDQFGSPVPGARLRGVAKRYRRVILPNADWIKSLDITGKSGLDGIARTLPIEAGEFSISVEPMTLPAEYDGEDNVLFSGGRSLLGSARRVHVPHGVDWVFQVHRFAGPRPLWSSMTAMTNKLPTDGSAVDWSFWHPRWATNQFTDGHEDEVTATAEFRVRLWVHPQDDPSMDSSSPFAQQGGKTYRDLNDQARWFLEIECLRGGFHPIERMESGPYSVIPADAPETGYRNRVVWSSELGDKLSGPGKKVLWWRRVGQPVRYAVVSFLPLTRLNFEDQRTLECSLNGGAWINPIPNDRRIEFPIRRSPAPWITQIPAADSLALAIEPIPVAEPTLELVLPMEALTK